MTGLSRSSAARRAFEYAADYAALSLALTLLVAFFGYKTNSFFTTNTLLTIINQAPETVLVTIGMTYVLITAGIDLSVGSVLALCGAVLGVAIMQWDWPVALALIACVAAGAVCGFLNGAATVSWSMPSFIVTLGMLEIARGTAQMITGSRTVYIGLPVERYYEASLAGVGLPFMVAAFAALVSQIVLSFTSFGRYMVAVGSSEEAARLSGIDPSRIRMAVFTVCGAMSGLAGAIYCGRLGVADPNAGVGLELRAIAAVVIGGTSLMGGRGTIVGSLFGVGIIHVLETGLTQMGAHDPTKKIVTGAVIMAAVASDYYRRRLRVT